MKAILTVSLTQDRYGFSEARAVPIDGPFLETFQPIDRCSDPWIAAVTGGVTEMTAKRITQKRREYASYLAEMIAKELMVIIEARDLENGYKRTPGDGERS